MVITTSYAYLGTWFEHDDIEKKIIVGTVERGYYNPCRITFTPDPQKKMSSNFEKSLMLTISNLADLEHHMSLLCNGASFSDEERKKKEVRKVNCLTQIECASTALLR